MLDIKDDFPLLANYNEQGTLIYVDNAATTQKPRCVLDALMEWHTVRNANPHRGSYKLGSLATDLYEHSRESIANHINAKKDEVVFCRNTTEALNLVAASFGPTVLEAGDEIVLPVSEHHSNLVPWMQLAQAKGCRLVYLLTDKLGRISKDELDKKITPRTKIVALAEVSNVLGTRFPVKQIAERAHEAGAYVVADCAQSFLHYGLDVQDLDVDFAAFSAHKAFGPDGIGVLWGREALLEKMPPVLYGGEMVQKVTWGKATFEKPPLRFEAGTQNASDAFAFMAAVGYLEQIGQQAIREHEDALTARLLEGIRDIAPLHVYGNPCMADDRSSIVAFNFEGQDPLLIGRFLDSHGINIRVGTHCAEPLMTYLGTGATCRISLAPYNTLDDIDALIDVLRDAPRMIVRSVLKKRK
ncbi:aminotransferase class V-fold PLP-dependent enzyme [Raoultibacter phocaeensis]|uniref:aminotransferase class V-fold PLP-dependent enzyme n=1 Tax=Raoultibacter phocaeensis TaxID=2479841 RepID=UPI0011183052|nr:SufS family cysteine desulfurase [Raoultibacter phocaeensis]